ncbi:putative polyketide synthase [Nemania sp. FL0916]|nr:putative polyketide synthase [Nemania sp. FL0916]
MSSLNHNKAFNEPIAIIGTACRFPGSLDSPSKLWNILQHPKDLLVKIPKERFNAKAFYHPDGSHHGTSNVLESYVLQEDPRLFDAGFFNIKPVEAHSIDPQQRILMEVVYESLENAGLPMESLAGSQTGVYVGLMCGDFQNYLQRDIDSMPTYMGTGTARSIVSNRISYFFDWHGPSMTIDTACSSSLVAVHEAVQLLRSGESDVAVAAGSNLILSPELYVGESKLQMLSPDSRSRMWDADANGYARGEGVASCILKRLSDAIRDGDNIECIIRESGVNSDGRTKGITMPNQAAQADLIKRTYQKAGLDPRDPEQRCQYFEAHGTGTKAGDGREAEGIDIAFFGRQAKGVSEDPLYVGSVKTVIGHTEGTAGLAGLMKASLALQNGIIPPNMHFNTLSSEVAPFYGNLEIATVAKPWPKVSGPRRASVNSFGFGGTNGHVILENFEPEAGTYPELSATQSFTPFLFSAASDSALKATILAHAQYLRANPATDLRSLSYMLHSRRSALGVRASFTATSVEKLISKLESHLDVSQNSTQNSGNGNSVRPSITEPRIIGVFTGQGAQWAMMGRDLLSSTHIASRLSDLQKSLDSLPEPHRPTWTLAEELEKPASVSRIGESSISQTLCTAVQVILVDLLSVAGVEFQAVVGHSSGEIGAAYAAGFISGEDAIRIAYYRGWFTSNAAYHKQGAMLAVGTTYDDATYVCELEDFEGRVRVAACNSSSSVTLSGDADAIEEVQAVFEDDKKFVRRLKVDQAYHSHHMVPISKSYADALQACDIQLRSPAKQCRWYSSVHPGTVVTSTDELRGSYWKENLLQPVLFAQAVTAVAESEVAFNLAIEVGPHPALKGPCSDTLNEVSGKPIEYTGLLKREANDIESFASALGFLWAKTSKSVLDFNRLDTVMNGRASNKFLAGLPSYQWDHDRVYWHESRLLRAFNNRKYAPHSLLGTQLEDGLDDEIRWRNLIRPSELSWIQGHQLQGQMVFPAAGYISTAVEAAHFLAAGAATSAIEITNFTIGKALVFESEQSSAESLFSLSDINRKNDGFISASFKFHASTNSSSDTLPFLASGRLLLTLGENESPTFTQPRSVDESYLLDVPQDSFYKSLETLGYEYSGDFKTMSGMRRKLDFGSAQVRVPEQDPTDAVLVHPALLDVAFQAIFLAYWWPGDGSLDRLHVPTSVECIRISTHGCRRSLQAGSEVPLESRLTENPLKTNVIGGDVTVFDPVGDSALIQVEGVRVTAFSARNSEDDRPLFSEHVWGPAIPDGQLAANTRASAIDKQLASDLERIATFYMKKISSDIPVEEREGIEWHHTAMFEYFTHILDRTREGKQPFAKREWLNDTWDDINRIIEKYPNRIELRLYLAVGNNLTAAVRGQTQILEHMMADNLLNRYYVEAMGLIDATNFLSRTISQIVHRYPRMNILEIGAGTGGATKAITRDIGRTFASYTFTDISTGFFEKAQEVFSEYSDKMIFKALDCEKDVLEQGFVEGSYDLVIGSLVLHATQNLHYTLSNARRLLKPGGYLVITELTNNDVVWVSFAMSGLPGWWLGAADDRKFSPCVSSVKWHELMLGAGFSGIDTLTPEVDVLARPFSVLVTQAVDDKFSLLREPLTLRQLVGMSYPDNGQLVIIGGSTLSSILMINEALHLMRNFEFSVTQFKTLGDVDASRVSPTALVLNLVELDQPVFQSLTSETMEGLKNLFDYQRTILWVTQGCRSENPYMNMSVGLGRSLSLEFPDVKLQFLDLEVSRKPNTKLVVETLLKLRVPDTEGMLWSVEREMVQENESILIPRLMPLRDANERYNAPKRLITINKSPQSNSLAVTRSGSSYTIEEEMNAPVKAGEAILQVKMATMTPVVGQWYGVIGTTSQNDGTVLAFATRNSSRVPVSVDKMLECKVDSSVGAELLHTLAIETTAHKILKMARQESAVLIHEPSPQLSQRIFHLATESQVEVIFTTGKAVQENANMPWIRLNKSSTRRAIKQLLPPNITTYIDCSQEFNGIGSLVSSCLPTACWKTTSDADEHMHPNVDFEKILRETVLLGASSSATKPEVVVPSDLWKASIQSAKSMILNWEAEDAVPVRLSSVNDQISFKRDKTYVLFGLTSDLATSLCEWMASRGATTIILTSRNPALSTNWLNAMQTAGVKVTAFANDITDRSAVESLVQQISRDFPPIAGIMHGAMVLQDTLFSDMTLEIMNKVLRPKVLGTIHLDELFQDASLDFFIMFSSLTSAAGNRGQSNYSAANMFMAAKVNERRRKGLAASVLHIGAVLGVGYVMRELDETVLPAIYRAGFMWMEERGFHQCIGEAILAGLPGSSRNPEIVTGLRIVDASKEKSVPWLGNPRFHHCVQWGGDGESKNKGFKGGNLPVKALLLDATSEDEVSRIVQDGFIRKLQVALQLPLDDDAARDNLPANNADDLGIDSLVAVEIRSWFQKELDVDLPVLKILGGCTIAEMLELALEKLSPELIPNVNSGTTSTLSSEVKMNTPPTVHTSTVSSSPTSNPVMSNVSSNELDSSVSSLSSPVLDNAKLAALATRAVADREADISSARETVHPAPLNIVRTVPLSLGQSRFWFLKHFVEDQTTFNITVSIALQGSLKVENFEAAVRSVANRHDALKTAFVRDGNQTSQGIMKESRLRLEKQVIQHEDQLAPEFNKLQNHVYDIEGGEIMRMILLSMNPSSSFLLIGYHHINMDGVSLEVFLADLEKAYTGKSLGKSPVQYPDWSIEQRKTIEDGRMKAELSYWESELSGLPHALPLLPSSNTKIRSVLHHYSHATVSRHVDTDLGVRISQTCRNLKASVFHFYTAVYEAALFRLLGTTDLCIGMADANRTEGQVATSMGMYLNLLPLRFTLASDQKFQDVLKDTRRKVYGAMAHSKVPFDAIVDHLKLPRSTTHAPLFQAFINYRPGVSEQRKFGSVQAHGLQASASRTAYDIAVDIFENPGSNTRIEFAVQKQLYTSEDAQVFLDTYFNLLELFSRDPLQRLDAGSQKRIVADAETPGIIIGSIKPQQWPDTLVHRLDEIAEQNPTSVALKDTTGVVLTYDGLKDRVNSIASALLDHEVKPLSVVAIYQEPRTDWICSMLAIMRVGAIYAPLDHNTPSSRLATIVGDCKPSALIADEFTEARTSELGLPRGSPTIVLSQFPKGGAKSIDICARSQDPAVILYTSGTTGVPKGVVLSHESLRNHMENEIMPQPIIALQHSGLGFDLSLFQSLGTLSYGGTLTVVPHSMRNDPLAITDLMLREGITCASATPSEFLSWLQYGRSNLAQCTNWNFAMSCGEPIPPKLVDDFARLELPNLHLWNAYGPSETTWGATANEISLDKSPQVSQSVGRPYANRFVAILDENHIPLPAGVPGEICIGGAGLAIGYLNDNALTDEKFIKIPSTLSQVASHGWSRVYRTGDKGQIGSDGALEIFGRIGGDTQIKLRGIRIELEDIESAILKASEGVLSRVVVSARGDPPVLVAHTTLAKEIEDGTDFLHRLLVSLPLPQYMRPAAIFALQNMPLTQNGKIDRRAIQQLPLSHGTAQATAAAQLGGLEAQLHDVWREVLSDDIMRLYTADSNSDFFHVGGNSMLLLKLQDLIFSRLGAKLAVVTLFENSTLGNMARIISDATNQQSEELSWDDETALTKDITDLGTYSFNSDMPKTGVVILTGASGFLGKELLRQLIDSPEVQKIHCIAVRDENKLKALSSSPKVVIHEGDLSAPRVGLSEETARAIFSEADALIHNGADVSFLKTYETLRAPNVTATKELAALALAHGVQFHYVSTTTVGQLKKNNATHTFYQESVARFAPPPSFPDGYLASKWASEVFLEKVSDHAGLPVWIHRPSSITGPDAGDLDVMTNIRAFSRRLKAVPMTRSWQGSLDFISVENTASGIIDIVTTGASAEDKCPTFVHHSGDEIIPVETMKKHMENLDSVPYRTISLADWTELAVAEGLNVLVAAYLASIDELKLDVVFNSLVKQAP